ncbi:hypothetical protein AMATHDRAFT_71106 [Amanita thiersii Skay4041]|uniref:WSC domain-containing protein n=1 Tax=Amanita thiersii Skay4041 TaxID=703135 RepID=A0A2A9N7Z0_9AGAR|nr:hypothetical protein AMATHDRAFT_71106 [Amanita thiersii Skay4041]
MPLDCDYSIRYPGNLTSSDECNLPCARNNTELCGGKNQILIYHDGAPGPSAAQTVGSWKYQGCYIDSTDSRTLLARIPLSGGTTIERCTQACKLNGYTFSGLEYSEECWCGSALSEGANKVSDDECSMACSGDVGQFCGAPGRLSVYIDEAEPPSPPSVNNNQTVCIDRDRKGFSLNAVYQNDSSTSPVPIKAITALAVPHIGYSILSGCASCFTSFPSYDLVDGALWLQSGNSILRATSYSLIEGESPSFISQQFLPPPYAGYCTTAYPSEASNKFVLAAKTRNDLWALCPNSTANGRMDVVWVPMENHPHYVKSACRAVWLVLN